MKALAVSAVFSLMLLSACGTDTAGIQKNGSASQLELKIQLYQRTEYNGKAQPVQFTYSGDKTRLVITYYDSFNTFETRKGGSTAPPVAGGHYFVLIEQYGDNGVVTGTCPVVEYIIEPKELRISAENRQEAVYDGNPKRVRAEADAPVSLSYSYFPSLAAMRTIIGSAETPQNRHAAVPNGLTRVEHPPIEPGTYYVLVYYSGDRNYQGASKEIEFTIKPRY